MDYASVGDNISVLYYILGYICYWGQILGFKNWIESSMNDFFELPVEVQTFIFDVIMYIYMAYLGLELIYGVILSVVVHPKP